MPIVRYIANLKTRVGLEQERIDAKTVSEALSKISSRIPDLLDFDGRPTGLYVILVNDIDYRVLSEEYLLKENDYITIIPVIHGG